VRVAAGAETVQYLSFTADGKSCVLNDGVERPNVFQVPDSLLASTIPIIPDGETSNGQQKATENHELIQVSTLNKDQTITEPILWAISASMSHRSNVLSGNTPIIVSGQNIGEVTVANINNTAMLSYQTTGSEAECFTLTRIPKWQDSAQVRPGIVLPDRAGEPIRVVLDKGIETWNRLADTNTTSQFPLVLERDVASFATQRLEAAATATRGTSKKPPPQIG
jgi:hypothetical protein